MFHDHHYIKDNPVEELAEAAIQVYTGIDIDITASNPERKRPQVFPIPRK